MAIEHHVNAHAKQLPKDLGAPAFVDGWKTRALVIGLVFSVIAAGLALLDGSVEHVLRAWLLGTVLTFGWAVGGLALLMVQYVSGGKWGLLLRRPLEAMSRTLPLVFVYWLVIALFIKKLYLWAQVDGSIRATLHRALKSGFINEVQAHCLEFKTPHATARYVLAGQPVLLRGLGVLYLAAESRWDSSAILDSPANTPRWIKKFENISGPGIVVYSLTMTAAVIYWVMSLDPDLVFVGIWAAVPRRPGLLGACARHHGFDRAVEG